MNDKRWDVFISHASEDKDTVARPLALALKKAGARVWLDEHELKLGDSLSGKIDDGLASSRFGVVILSPNFLAKQWPKKELAGLRALEEDGQKVILPVWHNVDKATVAKSSPVLADLVAISTSEGINKVASAIVDNIFSASSGSPSQKNPKVSRRLFELLDSGPSKEDFIAFLQSHPKIVSHLMHSHVDPIWGVSVSDVEFDAVALANLGTTRVPSLNYVSFLPIWDTPFVENNVAEDNELLTLKPSLINALETARRLGAEYTLKLKSKDFSASEFAKTIDKLFQSFKERPELQGSLWSLAIPPLIEVTIFASRRKYVDATHATARSWRDYRAVDRSCRLRTYDGLIEEFQRTEDSPWPGWNFSSYMNSYDPA